MAISFAEDEDTSALLDSMESEETSGKSQSPYWKPKGDGKFPIRFLKQLKNFNEQAFFKKFKMHYVDGRAYFCLNQTLTDKDGNVHNAETCPICQKASQLYNVATKGTPEWDEAGKYRAKDRYVSRIIVRGKKTKDGADIEWEPEFFEFGQKILDAIKANLNSGEIGNFLSLKDGTDFNIQKKGQKRDTDYSGSGFSRTDGPALTNMTKENLEKMMAELEKMNYDQLVSFETADNLKKVVSNSLNGSNESNDSKTETVNIPTDEVEEATYASKPAEKEAEETEDLDALINSI